MAFQNSKLLGSQALCCKSQLHLSTLCSYSPLSNSGAGAETVRHLSNLRTIFAYGDASDGCGALHLRARHAPLSRQDAASAGANRRGRGKGAASDLRRSEKAAIRRSDGEGDSALATGWTYGPPKTNFSGKFAILTGHAPADARIVLWL